MMMNSRLVRQQAEKLARVVMPTTSADVPQAVEKAYRVALGRRPTDGERQRMTDFILRIAAEEGKGAKGLETATADFCQALLGLKMNLVSLQRRPSTPVDDAAGDERIPAMLGLVERAIDTVCAIVTDLRPPAPDSTHRPDEDEDITTKSVTIGEARAMVERGDIVDLKTAYALTLIAQR